MRMVHRVKVLERRAASGMGCPSCRGNGMPAVQVAGAPADARPAHWPVGCRGCGRVSVTTWVSVGQDPTPEAARTFPEAI